jgi:hypothetical protein
MARFNIDGSWYDAPTYVEARKLAQAKAGNAATAIPKAGPPPPAHKAPPSNPPPAQKLPPPVAVVKPPVVSSKPGEKSFDMLCYRGEKNNWWSPPEERLICGMTLYDPWNLKVKIKTMVDLFKHLVDFINENCNGKIDAFAQYLRAQGRPFALATARTTTGSYTSDYNYIMKVANARTFLWGPGLTVGQKVDFKNTAAVNADYIVLNADELKDSTVLGFGHKCGTYEVTFLHDLSLNNIVSVNTTAVTQLRIKQQKDLSLDDKVKMRKYLRHTTSAWLG